MRQEIRSIGPSIIATRNYIKIILDVSSPQKGLGINCVCQSNQKSISNEGVTKSSETFNSTGSHEKLCSILSTPSSTNNEISQIMIDDQRDSVDADRIGADEDDAEEQREMMEKYSISLLTIPEYISELQVLIPIYIMAMSKRMRRTPYNLGSYASLELP